MTTKYTFPKYIALNGWPKAGKDEVAKLLVKHLDAEVIDDGLPLRMAAPSLYGFDKSWPFTQEGKAKMVDTPTGKRSVRDLLGTLGNMQEAEFGNGFMPFRALQLAAEVEKRAGREKHFVFPSVRKDQGLSYKEHNPSETVIFEIRRPGIAPSPFAFDQWDQALVSAVIHNNGTLEDLEETVLAAIDFYTTVPRNRLHMFNTITFKAEEAAA